MRRPPDPWQKPAQAGHPAIPLGLVPPRKAVPFATPLPPLLRFFCSALLVLTGIEASFELFCKFVLHLHSPYVLAFFPVVARFVDLIGWMPNVSGIHTEAFFHHPLRVLYPAPGVAIFWLFSLTGRNVLAVYMATAGLIVAAALWLFGRSLRRAGLSNRATAGLLTVLLVTSYPLSFVLYTANIELVVWLCTLLGVWAFSKHRSGWAATCFGIAAAIKLYPLAYLLLFLDSRSSKEWARAVQGVAVALLVTLASLWLMSPDLARSWQYVHQGNLRFIHEDTLGLRSGIVGYDHTLWALLKIIFPDTTPEHRAPLLTLYLAAVAVFLAASWFMRVRKLPLVNRVLFVVLASIWLTPTSYDYTLLHLYAPYGLLALACVRADAISCPARIALGCFAVLFTAQGFIIQEATHYGAQAKTFAMLGLVIVAAAAPLTKPNLSASH